MSCRLVDYRTLQPSSSSVSCLFRTLAGIILIWAFQRFSDLFCSSNSHMSIFARNRLSYSELRPLSWIKAIVHCPRVSGEITSTVSPTFKSLPCFNHFSWHSNSATILASTDSKSGELILERVSIFYEDKNLSRPQILEQIFHRSDHEGNGLALMERHLLDWLTDRLTDGNLSLLQHL